MRKVLQGTLIAGVLAAGLVSAGPASANPWDNLPVEVVRQQILPHLSFQELTRACWVNHQLLAACDHPSVWQHRLDKLPANQIDKLADRWNEKNGNKHFAALVAAERGRRKMAIIAGNGRQGRSQDGGLATASQLFLPQDMAIDGDGNILFAEETRIRRINADGTLTTIAGNGQRGTGGDGGPATNAELSDLRGVTIDKKGNIYIADYIERVIRRVDALSGNISTVIAPGQVSRPEKLSLDNAGNILVADRTNHMVHRIDPATGALTTIAGTGQQADGGQAGGPIGAGDGNLAINAQLNQPVAVAADHDGNILIAESYGNRLRKIDANGVITTVAHLDSPQGVTVDANGNILVTTQESNFGDQDQVLRIDPATGASTVVATGLYKPRGITMDANDNVLVADSMHSRIIRFGIQR